MIDLERLLKIPLIDSEGGFDISSDGTHLAFAWNASGCWEIYETDLNASNAPQPVSGGPGGKFAPRYSPDGSRLAFAVDFDGGENFHIFILDRTTRQQFDLTPGIDFAILPTFCWSPDGSQIAFLADKSGCFDTYVKPVRGGTTRLQFANGFPASNVHWSPDGCYLAVTSEGTGQDNTVYILPLDGNQPFPIAYEGNQINALNPAWSPDGSKLAFHSDILNGFHQIGIFDLKSRQISWLTDAEANCRTPGWSKDGKKLTYVKARGASDTLVVHSLGGVAREFQVDTGVHYKPRFTPDGKRVVFIFNNPRHPNDLWTVDLESNTRYRIIDSIRSSDIGYYFTAGAVTPVFAMPKEVTYPGMDETPIPALLFKSESASEKTPAVVVIHGGPNWHFQVEWYPFMIHLASRGWTVLAPNYRGSTGYGRKWQLANRFDLGGVDADDVAAGVSYLLDNKLADPKRIAVTGRSHGGYLTMSCLTRYPDVWCAGSAVVPFLNWFTAHENSREDLQHWDLQNFGNPEENHDLWYERSPFFFLDRINAPVQLICGENDPRCPSSESIQARDKLLEYGKEVDFILYRNEGHNFLKTDNLVDAEVRRLNFLAKALEQQSVS